MATENLGKKTYCDIVINLPNFFALIGIKFTKARIIGSCFFTLFVTCLPLCRLDYTQGTLMKVNQYSYK